MSHKPILISACLLGLNTKYNGKNNFCAEIAELQKKILLVPFCPEQLGGLPTPRPAVEIQGGDGHDVLSGCAAVKTADGEDRSAAFIRGAQESLLLAEQLGIKTALLKARSPSCGSGCIYDGSFQGSTVNGDGVTAAVFRQAGFAVYTEEMLPALKTWSKQRDS